MFNPEEAEICKRRGHSEFADEKRWSECKFCGTFYREVRTLEEREEEPPVEAQYPTQSTKKDANPEEAEICKRRGHSRRPDELWNQCSWCGLWSRYVSSLDERQDIPAEVQAERDRHAAYDKQLADLQASLERKHRKDQEPPGWFRR